MNGLFWRALLAFLALPGMVAFVIPLTLFQLPDRPYALAGLPLLGLGTALLLWCVREFYVAGRGTLAPWSPPRSLVTTGPYRYSRNPMYVAVVTILAGWALGFGTTGHWVYAAGMLLVFHIRVVGWEERWCAERYPEAWKVYRRRTPRWLFGRRLSA